MMNPEKSRSVSAVRGLQMILLTSAALLCFSASAEDAPMPKFSQGWQFGQKSGKDLYDGICAGCHMPKGEGATGAGAYPALANNPRLASSGYILQNVLNGRKGMPGFGFFMSDEQAAMVATYVRTNFGNNFQEPVKAEEAKAIRAPSKGIFDE